MKSFNHCLVVAALLVMGAPAHAATEAIVLPSDAAGPQLLSALRTWLAAHGGQQGCSLLVGDGFAAAPAVTIVAGDQRARLPYACGRLPPRFAGRTTYLEEQWIDPQHPAVRVRYFSGVGQLARSSAAITGVGMPATKMLNQLLFAGTKPRGAVTFEITVDERGRPAHVAPLASSLRDEELLSCVADAMLALRLPPPGELRHSLVPLVFSR